jgi:hypothetical protein
MFFAHFQASLVEADLKCPFVHNFRHKQEPEKNFPEFSGQ